MTDYLWHKVSEQEKKKIEQEAKDIITNFGDALEKVKDIPEAVVERDKDVREEGNGKESDNDFRKIMFKNAPEVKDDCIVAEKGGWVE